MGLSVWRETSKKLTVYRVCYTPIETLLNVLKCYFDQISLCCTFEVKEIMCSVTCLNDFLIRSREIFFFDQTFPIYTAAVKFAFSISSKR